MQRAAAPPHPPRPAARAENVPAAGRQGDGNAALAGNFFSLFLCEQKFIQPFLSFFFFPRGVYCGCLSRVYGIQLHYLHLFIHIFATTYTI